MIVVVTEVVVVLQRAEALNKNRIKKTTYEVLVVDVVDLKQLESSKRTSYNFNAYVEVVDVVDVVDLNSSLF